MNGEVESAGAAANLASASMPSTSLPGPVMAVILPGMDGSATLLPEFIAALRPEIDATACSYPPDRRLGYAELTDRVQATLPTGAPLLLIAESFSGPIGIELAARLPDIVRGLVLCASFATSPQPWFKPLRHLLHLPLPVPRAALLMPFMMGRWTTPDWTTREQSAIDLLRPSVARHRLREVLDVDVQASLRAIRCPVLYLQATHDRLVPARNWSIVRRNLPQAQRVQLRAPHFVLQAQPDQAARAIKAQLSVAHGAKDR